MDTDGISRATTKKGGKGYYAVIAHFGEHLLTAEGEIDRRRLGSIVFSDESKRRELNALIHPIVIEESKEQMEAARQAGYAVCILDVPLLFESGMDVLCDETWVITLSPEKQLKRLMERDNCTQSAALERINAQMPQEAKVQRATEVIDNERTEEKFLGELKSLYNSVRRRVERENA